MIGVRPFQGHARALPRVDVSRQIRTPLLDAVVDYWQSGVVRFHMPGHRGGPGADPRITQVMGRDVFGMDVTGVLGLDDLHQPRGVIQEAEELAAEAFGADHSFFLVNGTSAGVQAMILSACDPGDRLIVARNVHKSIIGGLILSGVVPVYVTPEVDTEWGIALGVTPEEVGRALERSPDVRGVLLVSPTYHGVTSDLEAIAAMVHERGKVLLVDEAHGPHFRFHEAFPTPALEAGADACAHGIHKMLSGFTQASMLHVKGDRIDLGRVQAVLRLLQSTSASYLLMSSLDAARMQMATGGHELLDRALSLSRLLRQRVEGIEGVVAFEPAPGAPGAAGFDPTKVAVLVKHLGLTGHQVERLLRELGPVQPEMPDLFYVLFIVSYANDEDDVQRLAEVLAEIAAHADEHSTPETRALLRAAQPLAADVVRQPVVELPPREAFFGRHRAVGLEQATGRIAAEVVTCYPPGIPLLCPGERITPEVVDFLKLVRSAGASVSGPKDPSLETLEVL
ncbi:aminotransferase class I/II-fold pyridoxal phosphate-dependent enzyme [Carboxydochorda subterranea]|uniref:Aminotransferase class I/II-fold pyridoxal phosphate-dependent enzyme n=1 Tax=Carboxydichorda subterranea TaxID=3109565 RepID=A0ABZ1BW14_9FIRM|nr:aminotransferase class I/II-fold pyridoxal phosphate-dependent enzyme [Limnochorda sp. L945t]WRP16741.1 aminotransferase class I/II-fold pyridoxal phosphate-dependent enzyme [Limnochorda sp. L945t]